MIRRSIAASAVAVLTLGLIPAATAAPGPDSNTDAPELEAAPATISKSQEKGTVLSLGKGKGRELYIVQLEDAAVPTYEGGVKGLAPVRTVKKLRDAVERGPQGVLVFTRPKSALGERLTVTYEVSGTAKRGKDYRGLDGQVTFAKNARQAKELVKALRRPGVQKVKVVQVKLVAGDGYRVGTPKVARVKVKDKTRR